MLSFPFSFQRNVIITQHNSKNSLCTSYTLACSLLYFNISNKGEKVRIRLLWLDFEWKTQRKLIIFCVKKMRAALRDWKTRDLKTKWICALWAWKLLLFWSHSTSIFIIIVMVKLLTEFSALKCKTGVESFCIYRIAA